MKDMLNMLDVRLTSFVRQENHDSKQLFLKVDKTI